MLGSLADCFAHRADAQPDRPFLLEPGKAPLSYGEEARAVAWAASALSDRGVRRGDRVAMIMENRSEWVTSFLATLTLGAMAVPLNTRCTALEIEGLLADCGPAAIVTDGTKAGKLESIWRRQMIHCADFRVGGAARLEPVAVPSDMAIISYTSGSTGAPKGVVLNHQAVMQASVTYASIFNSDPGFRTAIAVPLFHNTGFIDGLGHAIVAGGAVEIHRRFVPESIVAGMTNRGLNFFIGVPTMYSRMLGALERAAVDRLLRPIWLAYGGAPMPARVAFEVQSRLEQARLVNCYGMSETTSITHYLPAHLSPGRWDAVGIPVPGTLDRIAETGELLIDSSTVMMGYWNGGALRGPELSDGYLRTGDRATKDELGIVTIHGRMDEVINRGGEKVAVLEVEAAIIDTGFALEVAVVGVPDRDLGEVPAAVVVAKAGGHENTSALLAALGDRLADFKIPKHLFEVTSIPKTASGKVARPEVRRLVERLLTK